MIIIAGSLSFDPADREDVLASLAEVTAASRRDAGCVEYFWSEDLGAPNTFRFFECWDSPGRARRAPRRPARGRVRGTEPEPADRGDRHHLRGRTGRALLTGPFLMRRRMDLSRPRRAASALAGRAVDALPSGAGRRVRAALGRPGPRQLTFDELDAELDRATALMATAPDEAHALLQSFVLALPSSPPANPFSEPYREWTWALYRRISGRDSYDTSHEASPFDLELARERPFPYQSGSLAMVGRDLAARGPPAPLPGRARRRTPRGRVRSGLGQRDRATWWRPASTSPRSRWTRTSAAWSPSAVTVREDLSVERADMLTFFAGERFDAAVFYESFHHCADHLAMLRHLHGIVRPEGAVFFAAEPVQRLEYPWGPRLDGLSVWSSRTHGWLELGFDERYFFEALAAPAGAGSGTRPAPGRARPMSSWPGPPSRAGETVKGTDQAETWRRTRPRRRTTGGVPGPERPVALSSGRTDPGSRSVRVLRRRSEEQPDAHPEVDRRHRRPHHRPRHPGRNGTGRRRQRECRLRRDGHAERAGHHRPHHRTALGCRHRPGRQRVRGAGVLRVGDGPRLQGDVQPVGRAPGPSSPPPPPPTRPASSCAARRRRRSSTAPSWWSGSTCRPASPRPTGTTSTRCS